MCSPFGMPSGPQLHHVFLATDDEPAVQRVLKSLPGPEVQKRSHPGQGTRNRIVEFDEFYLEFLLPANEDELRSDRVSPLGLYERIHWRKTGASPIGIGLKHYRGFDPRKVWTYHPDYLPAGSGIDVLTPPGRTDLPLIFVVPSNPLPQSRVIREHRGRPAKVAIQTRARLSDFAPRTTNVFPPELSLQDRCANDHVEITLIDTTAIPSNALAKDLPLTVLWRRYR